MLGRDTNRSRALFVGALKSEETDDEKREMDCNESSHAQMSLCAAHLAFA